MAIDWRKKGRWTLRIGGLGVLVGLYAAWRMTQVRADELDLKGLAIIIGTVTLIWTVYFLVGVSAVYWPRMKDAGPGSRTD